MCFRPLQHSFEGLAILLIDYLASPKVDGYVDEVTIAADLRLSQKNIRKALRYLEGERLVASETVKFSLRRRNAEQTDDPEVEERKRQETHVFWCLDFPRMTDALRLRLHRVREMLRKQLDDADAVLQYVCPQCGAQYSSLNALALLDPMSGTFRCEDCRGELIEHTDAPSGVAVAGPGAAASRRDRQAFFKDLQTRFDAQLKPIIEQMERLREVAPPDFGSLQDWYMGQKEEAAKRAKRLEAARKRMLAGGAGDMTEEQLLEWAEKAEVVVALPGMEGDGTEVGSGLAPAKELPAWFRQPGPVGSAGAGGSQEENQTAETAAAASSEEQRRLLEQRYLEQYLEQVRALQAAGGAPATAPAGGVDEADAKRLKREVKAEAELKAEEDIGTAEEEIAWEDALDANGVAGGGAAPGNGAAAAIVEGDDVDWEDA